MATYSSSSKQNKVGKRSNAERDRAIVNITNAIKRKRLAIRLGQERDDALIAKLHRPLSDTLKDISKKLDDVKGEIKEIKFSDEDVDKFEVKSPTVIPKGSQMIENLGADVSKSPSTSTLTKPDAKLERIPIGRLPVGIRNLYYMYGKRDSIDLRMGIRYDSKTDGWKIGSKPVEFTDAHISLDGGKLNIPTSSGLYELIQLKAPKNFTEEDLRKYKEILTYTGAHKQNYTGPIASNRSEKYIKIIKPLFSSAGETAGSGLEVNSNRIQYKYWDDVNELVDRLRLLHASYAAGNNSHRNKIAYIVEELKEINVIK
ncbi:uncharacterized protein [Onthophagus taurus]|uniref:uncharacterized protein n=1 Tax=Onthophagus taurus TaxID=166361 RepID=UPI0039BE972A